METVLLLATEAGSRGIGINTNILETNLINLGILIVVLVYFGRGFLGKILNERRSTIEEAIKEAEQRQQQAQASLAEQQQKLTVAQTDAQRILAEAEERAKTVRDSILAKATEDVERMKATASAELDSDRERVISQLRSQIATQAIELAESQLKQHLNDNVQERLIDQSLALLGG
ncbi:MULTISPECIES: F0F1 ATP synthase subunit B [Planktothrix]|jgi:F-type H+-transporting ATPase subunit b|uniref:ATP synthase subunit b n=2 Tax=Planktothrix TaxID=54304 RepID=A0A479ZPC4_PLAAG|nr:MULTISPECIES: F0F1 ATP synthase subunit B [Planktothrix]CAD5911336.1 ATP synthase subunit b [Planktothrix rubescens]CAC5345655.1 ATP synthase subunit b [Planktothrix rubescens NIVA-CYA 18]CAD5955701.1 ATP synthase subunit b [Planktothrix rubescens NIVA-CYA 18]CAD5957008.1 ATP synthase subunit b [Planktothrix agardhii]CAH2573353.1 ATP synthase subunit b [Planktothrix rubescens]